MAGKIPDSTPGIRPAQWLDLLQKPEASSDFVVQLQLLTDDQLKSSSKQRLRRCLNQRASTKPKDSGPQKRPIGETDSTDGSEGTTLDGSSIASDVDGEVASTNAMTFTKASTMSRRDPMDTDMSDGARSVGRSEVDSKVGLDDQLADVASLSGSECDEASQSSAKRPRLTRKALDDLEAANSMPYNDIKRKVRKMLDKRRTGRVAETEEGLPACFHAGGLYDPHLGSLEVKLDGKKKGRWNLWCATCNEGQLPACPRCGEALAHGTKKGKDAKKDDRMPWCIACGTSVKADAIVTDPKPDCPGHYGHIQMPRDVWLVNPLQWGDVVSMLRGKCWWCHRWRAKSYDIRRRVASLRLLNAGLWTPALEEIIDQKFAVSKWAPGAELEGPRKKGFRVYSMGQSDEASDDMMRWVYKIIEEADKTKAERATQAAMFAKRREVVQDLWHLINAGSGGPCRHCGLINPKRIRDLKKSAIYYDMSGKDMDANIALAMEKKGTFPGGATTWELMVSDLKVFKEETLINKGGGRVVHYKQGPGGKGKAMREAAPRAYVFLPSHKIKWHLQNLFQAEQESLGEVFIHVCSSPDSVDPRERVPPCDFWKAFVHRVVEVGPNKFRPFRQQDGKVQADDQTKQISNLLQCARSMLAVGRRLKGRHRAGKAASHVFQISGLRMQQSDAVTFWMKRPRTYEMVATTAQDSYRRIMFARNDAMGGAAKPEKGTQQIFERKSGLFRTNLMGKRVNQACRSVISPDNNLEDNQVMLPRRFAKRLTLPEMLPSLAKLQRLEKLADTSDVYKEQLERVRARRGYLHHCIANGSATYPGATRVEMDASEAAQIQKAFHVLRKLRRPKWMKKPLTVESMQMVDTSKMGGPDALRFVLWMELALHKHSKDPSNEHVEVEFKVFRHVVTGDYVILNRQPTLHKSSWLGQRLVVGDGFAGNQRTIRFHYANCKGFNADFDGDEMNIHVPQTERAQMELRILNASRNHFISSTSGKPIRGLIQDHVVAGVLLSKRDTFLSGREFDKLLYEAVYKHGGTLPPRPEPALRVRRTLAGGKVEWVEAWTGKQVLTALLQFISKNFGQVGRYTQGICFEGRSALPREAWDPHRPPSDAKLEEDQVEVLHDYYCRGILDKNQLGATGGTLVQCVYEVHGREAAGVLTSCFGRVLSEYLKYYGFTVGIADLYLTDDQETARSAALKELNTSIVGMQTEVERMSTLMKLTGQLNKASFPKKMFKEFPSNCLSLMTMSGAKGSNVNSTQMAVILGQQTFDGRRVEAMASGKTLPGTVLGDDRASCGGFGLGRFLSGIRPQQYVVHATAGRDGLIDTAVKTSRSGYLQRSVIKGMEGLATKWQLAPCGNDAPKIGPAVIDEAGAIVQFRFGHDGLDPQKALGWKAGEPPANLTNHVHNALLNALGKRKRDWRNIPTDAIQREADRRFVLATLRTVTCSRKLRMLPTTHGGGEVDNGEVLEGDQVEVLPPDASITRVRCPDGTEKYVKSTHVKEREVLPVDPDFTRVRNRKGAVGYIKTKYLKGAPQSTAVLQQAAQSVKEVMKVNAEMAADEPVGIVAAQSVGEPSTQMTLNTFHQAGQTVSHVTEGIPRLRQILQSASVSEPMVLLPVEGLNQEVAKVLLRIHTILHPKTLLDVVDTSTPWRYSSKPTGSGQHYQEVKVMITFDKDELEGYYVGPYGVVDAGGPVPDDKTLKETKADLLWEDPDSSYRRKKEAMGLRCLGSQNTRQGTGGSEAAAGEEAGRCMLRLLDRKATGAVGDLHTSLQTLNRVIIREVQKSWNWDRTHDPSGFDARQGCCFGDTVTDAEGGWDMVGFKAGKAPQRPYIDAEGNLTKMELLEFDDIKGSSGSKAGTSSLELSAVVRQLPCGDTYEAKRMKTQSKRPELDNMADEEKRLLHKHSVGLYPDGLVTNVHNAKQLQYFFTLRLPLHCKLMVDDLLKRTLKEVSLRRQEIGGIKKVFFVPNEKGDGGILHVDGGKISQVQKLIYKFPDFPNLEKHLRFDKIRSTDHADMVNTFGVEVGQAALFEELKRLFKSYSVDSRWLSLVTDRAMHSGEWKGFSRFSVIASSPSILSRMTFETATKFLAAASREGLQDEMKSPAARIMLGQDMSLSSSMYKANAPLKRGSQKRAREE